MAQSLFAIQHVWFAWLILVAVQIPCALLCAVVFRSLEWIAQRRRLEEERRLASETHQGTSRFARQGARCILVHDLNWQVQYWNKSAELLYGWTAAETQTQDLRQVLSSSDSKPVARSTAGGSRQGRVVWGTQTSVACWQKAYQPKPLDPGADAAGSPQSSVVINTDITEPKTA